MLLSQFSWADCFYSAEVLLAELFKTATVVTQWRMVYPLEMCCAIHSSNKPPWNRKSWGIAGGSVGGAAYYARLASICQLLPVAASFFTTTSFSA
jgi:hypothetical protein